MNPLTNFVIACILLLTSCIGPDEETWIEIPTITKLKLQVPTSFKYDQEEKFVTQLWYADSRIRIESGSLTDEEIYRYFHFIDNNNDRLIAMGCLNGLDVYAYIIDKTQAEMVMFENDLTVGISKERRVDYLSIRNYCEDFDDFAKIVWGTFQLNRAP
ncbi:MAG: hypothetical protein AB8F95_15765 [Bacteroidia bacterium]